MSIKNVGLAFLFVDSSGKRTTRTAAINHLSTVVRTLGPAHILACGQPNIPIGYQSQLAWYMGVKTGILYVSPAYLKLHPHPLVNLYPMPQTSAARR